MTRCQSCQQPFTLMVMIETRVWRQICPEDGLLCVDCIEVRCRQHGLKTTAALSYLSDCIDAVNSQAIHVATELGHLKRVGA